MRDYFALLNFPRTPWLDPEAVQARFVELSAPVHPDRVHGLPFDVVREANERFAEFNRAAAILKEPRERLNHLLQLESVEALAPTQSIPAEAVEVFTRIGQACRDVDGFLQERSRSTSPVIQAQLFAQGLDWSDRISDLQKKVGDIRARGEAELKGIAMRWPEEKPLSRLRELMHVFAMVNRWELQLKERFASLAAF